MKTYCKHCSKDKSKHERKTLHCPLPSRSLMPSFGTDVYEEVQEILHTPNAVLTVKWKSSIPNVTDGESTTIVEWRGHELIDDDGDVMQFGYQAVQGVEFTFFVTADSTGQVSEVTLNENGDFYSKVGFGETEEPSTDDVSEIDSVLKVIFNAKTYEYKAEWVGNVVHEKELALTDLYFSDKHKADWDAGFKPLMTVTCLKTGQTSVVTYDESSADLFSAEEQDDEFGAEPESSTVTVNSMSMADFINMGENQETTSIEELQSKIDSYILPLWDKEWVLNEIKQQYSVHGHQDMGWISRVLKDEDGSIVLGKPTEDNDYQLYFGLTGDDQGVLDYVFSEKWADIGDSDYVLFGSMECAMEVYEDTLKKFTPFFTEVLGRSLCAPNALTMSSTADCKAFLKSEYNVQKCKRTKKEKWGSIEYRLFEDDNGYQYSIITYNDKLISHYDFAYGEY